MPAAANLLLPLAFLAAAVAADPARAAEAPVVQEWKVDYGGRPRDPYVAPDGKVWFVGQAGNYIANFDARTAAFRRYAIEDGTFPHSLIVDGDGVVWYASNLNARIGRLDPATGAVKEYVLPGGARSKPYALTQDGDGRLWLSQTGPDKKLVAFDPETERFVAAVDVSDVIRHMMYDAKTDAMWFGTDANRIGRVITRRAVR
jgi:streptogramin lyase